MSSSKHQFLGICWFSGGWPRPICHQARELQKNIPQYWNDGVWDVDNPEPWWRTQPGCWVAEGAHFYYLLFVFLKSWRHDKPYKQYLIFLWSSHNKIHIHDYRICFFSKKNCFRLFRTEFLQDRDARPGADELRRLVRGSPKIHRDFPGFTVY